MTTTPPTSTPATPGGAAPPHGWRLTWPMIVTWLVALGFFWPAAGPYILGEKHFDTEAGSAIIGALLLALNHSPSATKGGGLVFPPATALLVFFIRFLDVGGCVALLVITGACVIGCGGASAETRSSYAVEQARCVANEREIVNRRGTTAEEDDAALAAERARCDAALHAIEEGGSR